MNKRCGGAWTSDSAFEKRSTASLNLPSLNAVAPSVASERAPARCSSVCAITGAVVAHTRTKAALPRALESARRCMLARHPNTIFLQGDGRQKCAFGLDLTLMRKLGGGEPPLSLETPPQDPRPDDDLEAEPEPPSERAEAVVLSEQPRQGGRRG